MRIYEKLITDDKVDLLLAPFGTPAHLAIVPLLERFRFPVVANTASSVHVRRAQTRQYLVSCRHPSTTALRLSLSSSPRQIISRPLRSFPTNPPATEIDVFSCLL